jgi:phosphoribosyl 1,2-cyclic phosphate phosphodiesterase
LTHDHADAVFGLDDLRFHSILHIFYLYRSLTFKQGPSTPIKSPIPVHASQTTRSAIFRMFAYLEDPRHSSGHGIAPFTWNVFDESKPFYIPSCGNIEVIPLPVQHGRDHAPVRRPYICMGFRIKDFSYISDVSFVSEDTRKKVNGTRILVLDALRERQQSSHFNFEQVVLE